MLVAGDLGFLSPFLVVPLLFLAIGFVIRRKWRLVEVRKEEIRRLLVLASEEAARAELEASAGYGAVSMAKNYQCAVCYCPTTTRCAQCKAVRYCSGKCQIIHWRQGHKEECHPPVTNHRITDVASDSGQEAAEQEEYATYGDIYKTEDRMHAVANPIETFHEEPVLSTSCLSSEDSCVKDNDIKVDLLAHRKRTNSASISSGTSFSGFTASTTGELSDDVSISESISSNDSERLDGYFSADGDLDILETTSGVKNGDHSRPVSPKFASLVDAVDNFNGLSKLNQTKPNCSDMEIQRKSTSSDVENYCTSTSSPGLRIDGMREGSIGKPCTVSDGFWGTTLDGYGSRNDTHDDSALSNSNRAGNHYSSDSKSSLRFSFNLSGSSTPPLHAPDSKAERSISDDALPATLGISKRIDESYLSETLSVDAVKVKTVSLERSNCTDKDSSSNPHLSKSGEIKSLSSTSSRAYGSTSTGGDSLNTGSSNISSLPSSKSERSNHFINGGGISSHPLKSGEPGCLSSGASDVYLSSTAGGYSVPRVKTGKVDGVNSSAANSSYVAGCPPNARNGLKTSVLKVVDQFRGSKMSKHYPVGVGSEVAARYSDKGLFPYDLFVKLYNWNKVVLHPCGLKNCGNSCYANAVLQCLAFTPPLTAYFMQGLHSKACVKKEWCFMCEFESLILKAKEGKSPLSPIGILTQLQNISNQLGNGREEDAHEFLRYAIDTMQSVCLKESGVKASGSLEEDTTLIGLTFGGYLRSKIKCTKCQGKSERQERMMDLTVEIGGDIETLEEALRQFTGTEILDGENKYQCGRCKSYEKAKKKLTLLEVPNILTIALKRFQSGKFGKLNKPIRFPEILDLAPYMSGTSDKSPIYRLYGVVVHLDIMNAAFSGHYVCYVKNIQNKWFKIDDSTVTNVEPERALTKGAYMLLYARCSPRAPRLIRNRVLSLDPKTKSIPSRNNGKHTVSKSSAASTPANSAEFYPSSAYSDGLSSVESFYSRFHQLQRILEGDSSSDNSSLISSNSDEGSCSTESTRDSTSTDDLSDYIFGDSGHGWNSPWRNSSDSDASSSSSSPLYPRHSPLTELERHASGYPKTSGSQTDHTGSAIEESRGRSRLVDLEGKGSVHFLHSDTSRHCRKLSSSSSSRESESERLGWVNNNPLNDVKTGVSFRKLTRERRD